MRFAAGVPNVRDYADPGLLVALARTAEEAGWDGFFVWDHLRYAGASDPVVDPWIAVAAIAASTERIRLGVLVAALARRRPWKVARETASLDVLAGGRLVFGAGLGSLPDLEHAAFGEDPHDRVRAERLDEALEIVTGLWTGQPFHYSGRHHVVDEAIFVPTPLQRPRIPVWIAGRWPNRRPFRRAARWDGVFPTHREVGPSVNMRPEDLGEIVSFTLAHRTRTGPFDVVLEASSSGAEGGADVADLIAAYAERGLTWWVERIGWWRGSVTEMRARIGAGPPRP